MTATDTRPLPPVPTFPFSMFDPVHLGRDEYGQPVYVNLAERNMLLGGEPGAGKSSGLNLIVAHGALSHRLQAHPGRRQASRARHVARLRRRVHRPVHQRRHRGVRGLPGHHERPATTTCSRPAAARSPATTASPSTSSSIDEYAYFSATVGTKQQREKFAALTRDLVARGRAAGVIIILATQRPSHQVIDPSMRDLFGYRWAFRCTTDSSSDVVLGQGWAAEGYTAADIDPLARGVGWLLSETGIPRRIKAAYLDDDTIKYLAAYAARLRGTEAAA